MVRVVLDTNVFVGSAYNARSASRRIVAACEEGRLRLVTSAPLREEYDRVLPRAVRRTDQRDRLERLLDRAEEVAIDRLERLVPDDPGDDKVLATALAGAADALVTADRHLLSLDGRSAIRILIPSAFASCYL